jgi:hypothetical protein
MNRIVSDWPCWLWLGLLVGSLLAVFCCGWEVPR